MLDYIKGQLIEINPTSAVIEVGGLGYICHISINTYTAIGEKKDVKLHVYESIREDAHILYGFIDKRERALFLLLISVSGVGANTARVMLSSLNCNELEQIIASENSNALKAVKGIGTKTAERIIIDLKDKIKTTGNINIAIHVEPSQDAKESVSALVMLGFNQIASQKTVDKIVKDKAHLRVEEIIKLALKML
ncbi:component of RuvABC resolvasome regulatory subunit [Bacteroidales bacterium]|nr:component of RuvABC resolvasome regulatory subunit [Bacteroidales bacterium]